ncbi:MAG: CDP-alcohol phosphatidyltransferase family protein [Deltaproteobacteria bacterium]|nr:MAG: CDP-alcohol phosphatidyltransferase family protein [Deltaproteobacteria bacterium]
MSRERYRDRFDTEKVLTVANVITAGRIVLIPFFAEFTLQGRYDLAFLIFIVSGISDGIDGTIARLFRTKSRFGTLLDPIADKALMVTAFSILGILKKIPVWLVVTVISRDIIILGGALFIIIFFGIDGIFVATSSKINTVVQVVTVALVLAHAGFPELMEKFLAERTVIVETILFYVCEATALYSGFRYFLSGFRLLSEI